MTKARFFSIVNNRLLFDCFMLLKLPAAWFMGIRLRYCDGAVSEVVLPYGWRSQNPFRSTYFAAQCAAGELATGILALAAIQEGPPVSMLVLGIEADFLKKASAPLLFRCTEGEAVARAIALAVESGTPQTMRMTVSGVLPDGVEACRVRIDWSFRRKG
jgi:hypothetical protein